MSNVSQSNSNASQPADETRSVADRAEVNRTGENRTSTDRTSADRNAAGARRDDHDSRISPESIIRIKNLELRAKVVVEGFMSGLHRSPYYGFSVEFTDYRQYTPGDDPRYLDWKLYARQDRFYIKRFEDETNLRCYLLVDLSRSMGFGSLVYDKAEYAKTTAATIAYFLSQQRDAVGLLTFGEQIVDKLEPRFRPGHLRRLLICLEHSTSGNSTDLTAPLEQIARSVNKRGMVILISDLLAPVEPLEKNLGYLKSQGHDVLVLRILDPAEIDFGFLTASIFQDLETGREMYVDPQSVAQDYQRRFADHQQSIEQACDRLGIEFFQISTDQPLENALFDLVQARAGRAQRANRANPNSLAAVTRGDA